MKKLRQCHNNYRKEVVLMDKKHSEKEKTTLDSPSPKLNRSMIAYHETGDFVAYRLTGTDRNVFRFWQATVPFQSAYILTTNRV